MRIEFEDGKPKRLGFKVTLAGEAQQSNGIVTPVARFPVTHATGKAQVSAEFSFDIPSGADTRRLFETGGRSLGADRGLQSRH